MSGSGRKYSSKQDLRDEPGFAPDGRQLWSGWSSTDVCGRNSSKWSYRERNDKLKPRMGFSSKEPFSGGRGSNDMMNKDYRVSDAMIAWDNDGSYSMQRSPREEWKNKRRSKSPKNGSSKSVRSSRSRSPACGLRWDSEVNDRNRMRAGGSTRPCRAFAAGKCRRGNQCHFLHHDNQNYEDSWESRHRHDGAPRYSAPHESGDYSFRSGRYNEVCTNFAKGRCRMGSSCKYVHHENSDGFGKISVDESTREREIDRRCIEDSFERGGQHGLNHNGDTPCKFFAFGNCRNGNHCRFSHDRQACRSPNRRLRDDRSRSDQGGDPALDKPRLRDSVSPNARPRDDRWGSDGNIADIDKVWDSPKQNASDTVKLVDDSKNGIIAIPEPQFTAWPMTDGWDHSLDKSRVPGESPFSHDRKEANCWTAENAGTNIQISQSIGTETPGIWPGDEKMSPDWNYGVGSSRHTEKEHGHNRQQVTRGQGFNQNANVFHSSSCHAVGQSQAAVSIVPPRVGIVEGLQNQELSTEKNYTVEPSIMNTSLLQVGSRNTPTQNMVSNEQIAQLTSLTVSLAHILGSGQKLPQQIYATLNSRDAKDTSFLGKTKGSVSTTFVKPDPAVGFQKQYDPVCDSIEPKNANAWEGPPGFSPIKKIAEVAVEIPSLSSNSGRQNCDDSCQEEQLIKSENLIQLQQGENIEINKNNEVAAEERESSRHDNKITEENCPVKNMDQIGVPDEGKKIKDVKGIRAFKFSLVEYVKELLKPTWKEGQITKEDYKAIVKKVTDKVTGTVQRVHIPQTQEKIDHYLSSSKPKLNKLVQAYVEKAQKSLVHV